MRSAAVALLSECDMAQGQLLSELAPPAGLHPLSVPNEAAILEHLTEDHPHVTAVRSRNAALAAIHQLKAERVVGDVAKGEPLVVGPLEVGSPMYKQHTGRRTLANPIGMQVESSDRPLLQLTSRSRGWTVVDHEAFDPASFMGRPSCRLTSADGELVLVEALEDFRLGRFMSSTFMLGAFSETVWMEAASLCAPTDPKIAKEVRKSQPTADRVMTATLDFLAPKPNDYTRRQLEPWIRATLAVRNIIGHANILSNRTGSFTEASTAVRLVDSYRNVHDLNTALEKKGI